MARKKPVTPPVTDHEALSRVVNILSASVLKRWATEGPDGFTAYRDDVAAALRVIAYELELLEDAPTPTDEEAVVEAAAPAVEEELPSDPIIWGDEPPVLTPAVPEPPMVEAVDPLEELMRISPDAVEEMTEEGGEETASALAEAEVLLMMKKYGM
jgi:hypothetical protein